MRLFRENNNNLRCFFIFFFFSLLLPAAERRENSSLYLLLDTGEMRGIEMMRRFGDIKKPSKASTVNFFFMQNFFTDNACVREMV